MRKVKKDIRHLRFTLMVENPILKQKYISPNQTEEMVAAYARKHNLTVEEAVRKSKPDKWVVVAVGVHRDEAESLRAREYPGSQYRVVGARADYTPLETKRNRHEEKGV